MSLPGTTLAIDHKEDFETIMATATAELVKYMETGELSQRIHGIDLPDIPLWAVWAIQQYAKTFGTQAAHEKYMPLVEKIVEYEEICFVVVAACCWSYSLGTDGVV